MSRDWTIRRRHLLTGAGAVLALPFLESIMKRRAFGAGTSDPRRFVSIYMPSGTYNVQGDAVWYPPLGPLQTSALPPVLSPFTANLGDFSVIMHQGCNARDQASNTLGLGGHSSACSTWLSQAIMTDANASQCTIPGSSFDVLYANTTPAQKDVLVIQGGCSAGPGDGAPNFDYTDTVSVTNGNLNPSIKNPFQLFTNTFASLGSKPPPVPTVNAARNHSILDFSLSEVNDMQSKLGKSDNQKLDAYLTSVRKLESDLYGMGASSGSGCAPGTPPDMSTNTDDSDGADSAAYNARIQAFFDLVVLAFQCDLYRSVSFMFDAEAAQRQNNQCPASLVYGNADLTGVLHTGISHYGQVDNGRAKCISRDREYVYLFTYLLNALKGAMDPSGSTLLDNTAVLMGFNVTDGMHTNMWEGQPLVLGGGKNLGFHPGNCIDMRTNQGPPQRFSNNNNYGPGGLPNSYDMTDIYWTIGNALGMQTSAVKGTPFEGAGVLSL